MINLPYIKLLLYLLFLNLFKKVVLNIFFESALNFLELIQVLL